MIYLRSFLLTVLLVCSFGFVRAEEAITNFDVTIDVSQSGDFVITERITVNVEGETIRRGIFRDLPRYEIVDDLQIPIRYTFLSVTRNGRAEPYARETDGNARRLRIGDADVFIPHGLQTYEITYQVKDQIWRTEDFDAVYWNITGTYWRYPILSSSAVVNMAEGAKLQSHKAFTGKWGSKGSDAAFIRAGDVYTFTSTRAFAKREGLTILLKYDKGVIAPEPASTTRFIWWVRNGAIYILSFSLLAILGFYYRSWNKVGRDPVKDPVFARYGPPKDYSPAAVSFIQHRMISDHKALIATLMKLAVSGHIDIETEKKRTTLTPRDSDAPLLSEDAELLTLLFPKPGSSRIILKGDPNKRFNSAYMKFQKMLTKRYGAKYFKWNGGYMAAGFLLTSLAIFAAISQTFGQTQPYFWWIIGGLVALNIAFIILLPAPTVKGQKIKAEIEGFELYLKTAEKQRLDAVNPLSDAPPPMSIDHYEAMLPYAIALGVEAPWSKYFEKLMPVEARDYNPGWGGMSHGSFNSMSGLTDSMVSNISSGVSSAAPQSSGSSSGGGFSGGGGGGGGGGGW